MRRTIWTHVSMLGATLLYGASYRIAKSIMPEPVAPFAFIILRIVGAATIFWLLHILFVRERVRRSDYGRLFLCGFFGAALNMLFFFKGLSLTSPLNAALIMVVVPILVLFFSHTMGMERLRAQKILGILIGMGGSLLLLATDRESFSLSRTGFIGDIMVLINASSYALYLVLARPLLQRYHPLTVLKYVFLFGGICSLPIVWEEIQFFSFHTLSGPQWGSLLFVVFGATVCTYLLNLSALRYVQPSVVGYYVYVQPIFATFLDVLLGYSWPSGLKIVSALLIFCGVYVVSRPLPKKSTQKSISKRQK